MFCEKQALTELIVPINHIWDDAPVRTLSPHLEVLMKNISVVSIDMTTLVRLAEYRNQLD
jgi:hypothetical protein